MANEVRQRKKDLVETGKSTNKDVKTETQVSKPIVPKVFYWWSYLISPIFAVIITFNVNSFLDGQISGLENQMIAMQGRMAHMNEIWSPVIAENYIKEFEAMNVTFLEAKEQIMNYIKGDFTLYGDPVSLTEETEEILKKLRQIKSQEDEHYKVLAAERKRMGEQETFMAQLKYHSAGLIESTNIIQKTFDHHTEVIEENELGSQYVNFTVPVKDLSDKITTVLEDCRDMGKKRYIAEHLLAELDGNLDKAIKKVQNGAFDDIPDPVEQSELMWPLFEEFTGLKKDIVEYANFDQQMRDIIDIITDNERFSKREEILLDEEFGTPEDYNSAIKRMQEYVSMKTMKELVAEAKGIEKIAADMYIVGCQEKTHKVMGSYKKQLAKQATELTQLIKKADVDVWRNSFDTILVEDISKRQVGLERFIMQMKYQLIDAESKWATIYYNFLQTQKAELTKTDSSIEFVGDLEEHEKDIFDRETTQREIVDQQIENAKKAKEAQEKAEAEKTMENEKVEEKKKETEAET